MRRSSSRSAARRPTRSTSASRAASSRASTDGVAFRHELARVAVEESLSPARRLALHRSVLLALDGHPARANRPRAHRAPCRGGGRRREQCSGTRRRPRSRQPAPARTARRPRSTSGRSGSPPTCRRRACGAARGLRPRLLPRRRPARGDREIREAIECRRGAGAPLGRRRALTELADYLRCRGYLAEAEESRSRASRLAAGCPSSASTPSAPHRGAPRRTAATSTRSVEPCGPARRDRRALRRRRASRACPGHHRQRYDPARPRRRSRACSRRRWRTPRRNGAARSRCTRDERSVARPMPWNRHELVEQYIERRDRVLREHSSDLWRINVLAIAVRLGLERGRWDDASGRRRGHRRAPRLARPQHEALLVLALVRARRGDPGAATRSPMPMPSESRSRRVRPCGISRPRARCGGRMARAAVADVAPRPRRCSPAALDSATVVARAAPLLATRSPDLDDDCPLGGAEPWALPLAGRVAGGCRRVDKRTAAPTRRRSRSRRPTTRRRCGNAHAECQRLGAAPARRDGRAAAARAGRPRRPTRATPDDAGEQRAS